MNRLRTEAWLARQGPERRRTPLGYVAALAGVAIVTWLISFAPARLPAHDLEGVYLLLVLALAAYAGSGPAIVASALAFLAFDWVFVKPVGRFTVDDPAAWLALILWGLELPIPGVPYERLPLPRVGKGIDRSCWPRLRRPESSALHARFGELIRHSQRPLAARPSFPLGSGRPRSGQG